MGSWSWSLIFALAVVCPIEIIRAAPMQVDSIIQESSEHSLILVEDEYNAPAEKDFANEMALDAEAGAYSPMTIVSNLLNQLERHIAREKKRVAEQANRSHQANERTLVVVEASSNKQQLDAMKILADELESTAAKNNDAQQTHAGYRKHLSEATTKQKFAAAQKKLAEDNQGAGVEAAARSKTKCKGQANEAHDRIKSAGDKQLKIETTVLSEDRKFISDVSKLIGSEGSELTQEQAMNKLSMKQKIKLKSLMAKERGTTAENRHILSVLKKIHKRIDTEETNVYAKARSSAKMAGKVWNDAKLFCAQAETDTAGALKLMVSDATMRNSVANNNLSTATMKETAQRKISFIADAAQKAAEKALDVQTPILQKLREARMDHEQKRFDTEKASLAEKLQNAEDYLDGELSMIVKIRRMVGGISSKQHAVSLLQQVTERLVTNFLGTQSAYVSDLSEKVDRKSSIQVVLRAVVKKAKDAKLESKARAKKLNKENVALKKNLESKRFSHLQAQITVAAIQKDLNAEVVLLKQAKTVSQTALESKIVQGNVLAGVQQTRKSKLLRLTKITADAEAAADSTYSESVTVVTQNRDNTYKSLNEELKLLQEMKNTLKGIKKPVKALLEHSSNLSKAQQKAVSQLVSVSEGGHDSGSSDESISDLLQGKERKIRNELAKVKSNHHQDIAAIKKEKRRAYAQAKSSHTSAVDRMNTKVSDEKAKFDKLDSKHESAVKKQQIRQGAFDSAAEALDTTKETQKIGLLMAKSSKKQVDAQAEIWFNHRKMVIARDLKNEQMLLGDMITTMGQITGLVIQMSFVSSEMLQYDNRTSYHSMTAGKLKTKTLDLIDGLISQTADESVRCFSDYTRSTQDIKAERIRATKEAKAISRKQTKALQDAVDAARKENKESSEKEELSHLGAMKDKVAQEGVCNAQGASLTSFFQLTELTELALTAGSGKSENVDSDGKAIQFVEATKAESMTPEAVAAAITKITSWVAAENGFSQRQLETATSTNMKSARVLADALATQKKFAPKVLDTLKQSLAEAKRTSASGQSALKVAQTACNARLDQETALLETVRQKTLGGADKEAEVQLVAKALQLVGSRQGVGATYKGDINGLVGLLAKIRAKTQDTITNTINKHAQEETEIKNEQNQKIDHSKKALKVLEAKIQALVNTAQHEKDTAESARAVQEKVQTASEKNFLDHALALLAAKRLQETNVAAATKMRHEEVKAADATFKTETTVFNSQFSSGTALLDREVGRVDEIKDAINLHSKHASLLSKSEAIYHLLQLHAKYVGKDYDSNSAISQLNDELTKVTSKLKFARAALKKQHNANVKFIKIEFERKTTASNQVLKKIVSKHIALVAAAQKRNDDALTAQTNDRTLYGQILNIGKNKEGAFEAALQDQRAQVRAGATLSTSETNAANKYAADNLVRIAQIKRSDLSYLREEIGLLDELAAILKKLRTGHRYSDRQSRES